MNNKRFILKLLGISFMETLNISGKELRKTIRAVILGLAFLKIGNKINSIEK